MRERIYLVCIVLGIAVASAASAYGASPNVLDVCGSGCTYSTVQGAIDAIGTTLPASSASNPYVILVDAGVLSVSQDISTNGKSYITFAGRGIGASIVRASTSWFQQSGATHALLNLTSSTHITIHDLTIDALTNDDGSVTAVKTMSGVDVTNCDEVVLDNAEVSAVTYGITEFGNTPGNLIQLYSTKVVAALIAARAEQSTWDFFACDLKADTGLGISHPTGVPISALKLAYNTFVRAWSTHFYAESDNTSQDQVLGVVFDGNNSQAVFVAVGCTLGGEYEPSTGASTTHVAAIQISGTFSGKVDLIGSQLNYETGANLTNGEVSAVRYGKGTSSGSAKVRIVSTNATDRGGSGGTYRADVLAALLGSGASTYQPDVKILASNLAGFVATSTAPFADAGAQPPTTNTRSGTATLSPGISVATATVTLPVPLPNGQYRVSVISNAPETLWITNKQGNQFTINSSVPTSTSTVDWILVR